MVAFEPAQPGPAIPTWKLMALARFICSKKGRTWKDQGVRRLGSLGQPGLSMMVPIGNEPAVSW